MSKVQVDTIVDKDDISAPSLTKGAIVTGVCTATSFDGAISEWVLGANGSSDYTFTGSGLTGAENDPTLYLKRGQKYRFKNSSGGHPFRIQSTANGSTGTAYNDGVTNNDAGNGTTLEWDVQFDAPDVLYYQCTAHGSMGGKIYIGNSGNSATLVDLNVSGVTTTGIATVTTSVVVGSAVTANADGVIIAGVTTTGIGTVTTSVVVGSAVTANSDGVITSGIITATSFAGDGSALTGITQTTINNNANNLLITGSGTANTLEAESQLTYDGTNFQLKKTGSSDYNEIIQDANPSSENATLGYLSGYWNTERVADIRFAAGDDTSNKNNAQIVFRTTNEGQGNVTDRLRIGNFGQIGLPVGPIGTAATDWGATGQVLTSGGSSASPTWATPSSGAWQLVNSGTIDSVSQVISDSLDNTYQMYRMNFYIEMASNSQLLGIRVKTGGSTPTSNYFYQQFRGYGNNETASYSGSDNRMFVSGSSGFRVGTGTLTFGNVESTTQTKIFRMAFAGNNDLNAPGGDGGMIANTFSAGHNSTTAITGISFFKDGSAPTAGWFVLEGCAIS